MKRDWSSGFRPAHFLLLWVVSLAGIAQPPQMLTPVSASPATPHSADYDRELRRPDGRVDTHGMAVRLKELGVTTYYWLVWHAPTGWDDLKLFLPEAREAGIQVWVYLVPPSDSPPQPNCPYSEPFRLDYHRWAEEKARLSLEQTNLTGWVIDDFYASHQLFTPAYLRQMHAGGQQFRRALASRGACARTDSNWLSIWSIPNPGRSTSKGPLRPDSTARLTPDTGDFTSRSSP